MLVTLGLIALSIALGFIAMVVLFYLLTMFLAIVEALVLYSYDLGPILWIPLVALAILTIFFYRHLPEWWAAFQN